MKKKSNEIQLEGSKLRRIFLKKRKKNKNTEKEIEKTE